MTIVYQHYIETNYWNDLREKVLSFWEYRCSLCNSPKRLQVHHRYYGRIGKERITDLIVLCDKCHTHHHKLEIPYGAG